MKTVVGPWEVQRLGDCGIQYVATVVITDRNNVVLATDCAQVTQAEINMNPTPPALLELIAARVEMAICAALDQVPAGAV